MDASADQIPSAANNAKLHGEMCKKLAMLVNMTMKIFPALEAARPRRKSGIQALCAVHLALEKAKSLLQHCEDCSKLYLAITGDSVLVKFGRVKDDLYQSLRRLEVIVPENLAWQIAEIFKKLEETTFALEPSEKEIGDLVITLLQQDKDPGGLNDALELEAFHQAAMRLGISSSRAVLIEKRGLKRLLNKARCEEDKRKESIILYFLHLIRKYGKLFRNEYSDDVDSQSSDTCSPSVRTSVEEAIVNGRNSNRHESKCHSFELAAKETPGKSGGMPLVLPEEFRCPISLQLMSDPVIISSGQTYERRCIEKWFNEGHDTCPKTQQKLPYLSMTPNYCVKGLIASWCDKHAIKVPEPPSSPPLPMPYGKWQLSGYMKHVNDACLKQVKVVPLEDNQAPCFVGKDAAASTVDDGNCFNTSVLHRNERSIEIGDINPSCPHDMVESQKIEEDNCKKYERLLSKLTKPPLELQCMAAEEVRLLSKDDEEACSYMGANHFIPALISFLWSAAEASDIKAQEIGCFALFHIAVNNNRNKASILSAGALPVMLVLLDGGTTEAALAVLLALSSCDDNKASIGASGVIPRLVELLRSDFYQRKQDALNTLHNLSSLVRNQSRMVSAGAVSKIVSLLGAGDTDCTESCINILYNVAGIEEGRAMIAESEGCIVAIAELLDTGSPKEQEQATATLLLLCTNSFEHCQLVLREGVIPSLVTVSVNGSPLGRDKAQKLLQHFREQRQRDASWQPSSWAASNAEPLINHENHSKERRTICKTASKRIGRTLSFFRRSKSFSLYQCWHDSLV